MKTAYPINLTHALRRAAREEEGGITALNLSFALVLAIAAGLAIDIANLVTARTQLQVAADAAAHATLSTREWVSTNDEAKQKGVEIAHANMPVSAFGDVLRIDNIHFGTFEPATKTFTIDESVTTAGNVEKAVYVETDRLLANANPVSSFLLQFAGFWNWDVRTSSVFEIYRPRCLQEGFVAENMVDIQSNNGFYNGFCIHSNSHVEVNQNNEFEHGTIVSMPDKAQIVLPSSGYDKNDGLEAALRSAKYNIKILNRLDEIKAGVNDPNSPHYRDFLTNDSIVDREYTANNNSIAPADFTTGRIYDLTCTKPNGSLSMSAGPWKDIVIITNCPIVFGNNAVLENATIITTNTGDDSWKAPQGLVLGKDDNCNPNNSVQLISYGSVSTASKMEIYGSQIIAAGDVAFSANADGIEGASIIAGGTISGTSNMSMAFCGEGMENNFGVDYFRLIG